MKKTKSSGKKFYTHAFMNSKGGMSTMTIGAIGAVGGALLGAAGALALADQNKRKMLIQPVSKAREYATSAFSEMTKNGKYADVINQTRMGRKGGRTKKSTKSKKTKK
jgi:hypothetical protein